MRGGKLVGHSRRVADLARKIEKNMGMDAREIQAIFVAGLLADIGKIGFLTSYWIPLKASWLVISWAYFISTRYAQSSC